MNIEKRTKQCNQLIDEIEDLINTKPDLSAGVVVAALLTPIARQVKYGILPLDAFYKAVANWGDPPEVLALRAEVKRLQTRNESLQAIVDHADDV